MSETGGVEAELSLEVRLGVIQELLEALQRKPASWTQLSKQISATPSQFQAALKFLADYKYVEKQDSTSRAPWRITEEGKKLLDSLPRFRVVDVSKEAHKKLVNHASQWKIDDVNKLANIVLETALNDQNLVQRTIQKLKRGEVHG